MLQLHVYIAAVLLFSQHGYSQKQGDSCVIEHSNTPGVCAPATSCQSARRDYEITGIAPTFCRDRSHGPQKVIVCCSDESSILNMTPNSSNNNHMCSNNQQTNKDNKRLSEKKCEEYNSQVFQIVSYLVFLPDSETITISVPKCDYSGVEFIEQKNVNTGEFPHMAAIGWANFEGTYSFLCDGSLISTKFVLTAAHCTKYSKMKDPNPVIVRLGDQNLDPTKNDNASPIEVPIKNIRNHPQYKPPGKYHDIALLELASDIDFDVAIRPACLWNKPDFPGYSRGVVTGWGTVDLRTQRTSDELQRASLSLLENDNCNYMLRTKKDRIWADSLTDNQICAEEFKGGNDTCLGNSGSPLQVESHGNKCVFHVIGVTSFGFKCAQSGSPTVYTRVSSYLDWIESVVWPGES